MGLEESALRVVVDTLERSEAAHAAWAYYQGGADPNWATFYARFLVEQSPMPEAFAAHFPEGLFVDQVIVALRAVATDHLKRAPEAPWPDWYAEHLVSSLRTATGS